MSPRSAGDFRAQNVSGEPMPYLQDAAVGEGAAEGAVEGEGAAAVGEAEGAGLEGVDDPPPHDNETATSAAIQPVLPFHTRIPTLPSRLGETRRVTRAAAPGKVDQGTS
jgi:hypothetical protein